MLIKLADYTALDGIAIVLENRNKNIWVEKYIENNKMKFNKNKSE